jgi:hypothetical protein
MPLDPLTEQWLVQTVEDQVKEIDALKERLVRAERKIAESIGRASSIQVGDTTKGGPGIGKCYFDPLAPRGINDLAVLEARRVWLLMGGVPLAPQPFDENAERAKLGLPQIPEKKEGGA